MDFIDALAQAKAALNLSDAQIARDCGMSRAWMGAIMHRKIHVLKRNKIAITSMLCARIDSTVAKYAEDVSLLERVRKDLKDAMQED